MRSMLASAATALLVAVQGVTIDLSRTAVSGGRALPGAGPDGATALELRATTPSGTSFHLITIYDPQVTGPAYVVAEDRKSVV